MAGYLGAIPVPQATQHRESFTATSGQTTFNTAGYTVGFLDVYLNGSHLSPADFTATNGSDVVLASGASTGDVCDIISYTAFEVANQTFTGTTTLTGDLALGDNDKAIFGAGSDLQIYHDGSNSYIKDVGTGDLTIAGTNLQIRSSATNENFIYCVENGAVNLYHNDAQKLATTSTGVDITGGFTATDGSTITTGDNTAQLTLISTDADANDGPLLVLNRNSSSPADNDKVGQIQFFGEDDASNSTKFGSIVNQIKDASNGSEDGRMSFNLISAGSDRTFFNLTHDGTQAEIVVNEDSQDMDFRVESDASTHALFVEGSSGSVGIGTSSPSQKLHVDSGTTDTIALFESSGDANAYLVVKDSGSSGGAFFGANGTSTIIGTGGTTERIRIDSSGNVMVGTTDDQPPTNNDASGIALRADGKIAASRSNGISGDFNTGADGDILFLRKAGAVVGTIGSNSGYLYIGSPEGNDAYLLFGADIVSPATSAGANRDNAIDLGHSSARFDDIFATNGTIQTSDRNEKQAIASLTSAEMLVAKRISALFKTFRWKDKVAAKGNDARTHSGIIAQDVQAAFAAESLDASKYALWCSDTWWEHDVDVPAVEAADAVDAVYRKVTDSDGNEINELVTPAKEAVEAKDAYTRTDTYDTEDEAPEGATSKTRMGIRYPELLSFLAAYNEQRFAAIETRLTALENA